MFEYQKNHRYFAQTPENIQPLAAAELERLGASEISSGFRGIYFFADLPTLYKINYNARLITRVLAPLLSFECRDRDDLYKAGRYMNWSAFFSSSQSFGIVSNVSKNDGLKNGHFAALCLKDAVVDYFRAKTGRRPDVDIVSPDIRLNLYIDANRAIISMDVSGGSLHRRGYRKQGVAASMQEILAAAVVAMSEWDGEKPLVDPMCGSGTLLCEALMAHCRIPSGYLKHKFGFFHLPEFDQSVWLNVKSVADDEIRPLPPGLITGSDESMEAVKAMQQNCLMLPQGEMIRVFKKDFREIAGLENQVIICNPPYGFRVKTTEPLETFYRELGNFLKHRCKGSQAYLFFGNREMIKHIGLKPKWKKPLKNAELDGRVVKYELY